jgi:N-acyl-D-amino-acid deacylase
MCNNEKTFAVINAEIFDGSGAAPFFGDVVVKGSRIAAVAPQGTLNLTGVDKVDAESFALAPGFIDAHSHSDATIMRYPESESRITQGFTSEVTGQCGDSDFIVLSPQRRARLKEEYGEEILWNDLQSYTREMMRRAPAVNTAFLAGHGAIREEVMGFDNSSAPSAAEAAKMKELLDSALNQGAAGLSSGLVYLPGKYAAEAELFSLASTLRGTGKVYATHLRSEADDILNAVDEAIECASRADGKLIISHLKTMGRNNHGKADEIIAKISAAQKKIRITADRYPYLHAATQLRAIVPEPFASMADLQDFLNGSDENRAAVTKVLSETDLAASWQDILLAGNDLPQKYLSCRGKSIAEIAAQSGVSSAEMCVKLFCEIKTPRIQLQCMCQENLLKFLSLDFVAAGSDSSGVPADPSGPLTHPRAFGTAPRFFRAVSRITSAAEAVRRMTSLPASVYNLAGRGLIRDGFFADLVLFDRRTFDAPADYTNPRRVADGVKKVWVNGAAAFDEADEKTRARAGVFMAVK